MARTKREILLVDGYNMVNQWKTIRDIQSIDNARNQLIEYFVEYQAYKGMEVIIVFDAYMAKSNGVAIEEHSGVKVVYTKEHQTADTYIEMQLDKLGRDEKVTVATSDAKIQEIAISRGGIRLSASEMYYELTHTKDEIIKKTKKHIPQQKKLTSISDATMDKLKALRDNIQE